MGKRLLCLLKEKDEPNAGSSAYRTLAKGDGTWGAQRGIANWSGVDPGEVHGWPLCEVPRLLWFQN